MRDLIASIEAEYRRYKTLGEGAINQVADSQLAQVAGSGNSIVTIVWHLAGNLKSRFTDFLTSDGEKPWRDRDSEFVARHVTRAELQAKWEEGWRVLFAVLADLADADLEQKAIHRVANRGRSRVVSLHLYGIAADHLTTGINRVYRA